MGLDFLRQSVVGGGDGQFTDHRGVVLNQPVQVDIPSNQVALGGRRHPALVGVDQLQGVAGELELLLERVVWVAHGAHGDEGRLRLPGQVVPEQAQGVRLATTNSVTLNEMLQKTNRSGPLTPTLY